jgi:NAD(P)-dependent dehydrogenase (short-subunit alcohol dehydrogenase family)
MDDTDYRVAIVTGGAGGLGVAIAGALLETGHKVVLTDLSEDALSQVREEEFKNSEHVLAFVMR